MSKKRIALFSAGVLLLIVVGTAVLAQTSANFNLEWHVMAGGGQTATSANYQIDGTIGQSLAGPPAQISTSSQLTSGYWVVGIEQHIFLPSIMK